MSHLQAEFLTAQNITVLLFHLVVEGLLTKAVNILKIEPYRLSCSPQKTAYSTSMQMMKTDFPHVVSTASCDKLVCHNCLQPLTLRIPTLLGA